MPPFSAILLGAAISQATGLAPSPEPIPVSPHGGAQAVAMAMVEVLPAARGVPEQSPHEPRRQTRRGPGGQTMIEFE